MNSGGATPRAVICPQCRKLITADMVQCPHCKAVRPQPRRERPPWLRVAIGAGGLLKALIGLNIALFVIAIMMNPQTAQWSPSPLTFLSPDSRILLLLGATGTVPIDQFQRWWTLVSANYLHGSLLHILFNMVVLRQIAPLISSVYGAARMLVIYTVGGIAGYGVSYLAGIQFTLGASAAICALMGAAVYYGKSRGGPFGQAIYRQIGGWMLGILVFGLLVPGINNWGHGGGFVGGVFAGILLGYREHRPDRPIYLALAAACGALTVGVLAWALVTGVYYRLQM